MDLTSTSAARRPLNETGGMVNRLNMNIPHYLFREVPTVFEVIGVILNIAIIVYFIKSKKYRTPTFTVLTSLASMDTFVCLAAAMTILIVPRVVTPEAGFLCSFYSFVILAGQLGSNYTLILFAGVRLYQVLSPLKARASITASLVGTYCATINAVSAGLSILQTAYWRSETTAINGEDNTVCIFIGDSYYRDMALLIVLTVIPCLTIFLLHVLKYFAYLRSKGALLTKQERKSPDAHVIAIVIIIFYICSVPVTVYITIQQLRIDNYAFIHDNLYLVLAQAMYANSIMNPLVYVLAMKSIRNDVINVFCLTRHSHSN